MRRMLALADRSPTIAPDVTLGMYAVVLSIWFQYVPYTLVADPRIVLLNDVSLQLWLLVSFGVTFFVWMSLHAFGFVGGGSGAGFRLVLFGLAARISVALLIDFTGADADQSIYDGLPLTAGPVWWARNGSLVAYGCGLALVVLATATDLVRRRRGPRWAIAAD